MPADPNAPVSLIGPDDEAGGPRPEIALCLSGGGYRAMLFHVGVLWRLVDSGVLAEVDRVSSVSGGSITAGASPSPGMTSIPVRLARSTDSESWLSHRSGSSPA